MCVQGVDGVKAVQFRQIFDEVKENAGSTHPQCVKQKTSRLVLEALEQGPVHAGNGFSKTGQFTKTAN
jgi:hypothetical protein